MVVPLLSGFAGIWSATMVRTPWGNSAELREKGSALGGGRRGRRPSATSARGCSGRWWQLSPRRATRRRRWPTWSSSRGSRAVPSTATSRTSRPASWRRWKRWSSRPWSGSAARRAARREWSGRGGVRHLHRDDRRAAGGGEDVHRRGLRRRLRRGRIGRPDGRVGDRRRRGPARAGPRTRGDAAGTGAFDRRRRPEGDPQAPLSRSGAGAAGADPAALGLDLLLPGATRPVESAAPARCQSPPVRGAPEHATPPERILRALAAVVAKKGYPDTTVAEVVDRAQTSQRPSTNTSRTRRTRSSPLSTAARPTCSPPPCPPSAARPTGRRPSTTPRKRCSDGRRRARVRADGRQGDVRGGKRALDQREVVTEGMEGLLAPGYDLKPETPAIAAEAIGGALYELLYDHVNKKGPATLPELVPTLVYVTLAPFLEAAEAYEVAVARHSPLLIYESTALLRPVLVPSTQQVRRRSRRTQADRRIGTAAQGSARKDPPHWAVAGPRLPPRASGGRRCCGCAHREPDAKPVALPSLDRCRAWDPVRRRGSPCPRSAARVSPLASRLGIGRCTIPFYEPAPASLVPE